MTLKPPTPKQAELLHAIADFLERELPYKRFDETDFPKLGITEHAILARLSGLRRSGWLQSSPMSTIDYMEWWLSYEAAEQIGYFA